MARQGEAGPGEARQGKAIFYKDVAWVLFIFCKKQATQITSKLVTQAN